MKITFCMTSFKNKCAISQNHERIKLPLGDKSKNFRHMQGCWHILIVFSIKRNLFFCYLGSKKGGFITLQWAFYIDFIHIMWVTNEHHFLYKIEFYCRHKGRYLNIVWKNITSIVKELHCFDDSLSCGNSHIELQTRDIRRNWLKQNRQFRFLRLFINLKTAIATIKYFTWFSNLSPNP